MENPLISPANPTVNDTNALDVIHETLVTPESSDDELDDHEIILKNKKTARRKGSVFQQKDFHKTRADVVKEVNIQLIPVIHITFAYVCMLTCIYWLVVIVMPNYYIRKCNNGKNYSLTVFLSTFLIFTGFFEYKRASEIVKIIEPLSGHSKLSKMQYVKLFLGFLGKLDIYTKYCFILIAHKCNSEYAWIATGLLGFWVSSLLTVIIYNYLKGQSNFLQLTDYGTLFDILGKYEVMYLEGEKSDAHKLLWTKRLSLLPVMKLFFQDIGQFIVQILFLLEMETLSYFVMISLIISLFSSVASVTMLYIKYRLFTPNLDKEDAVLHSILASIKEEDFEKLKKILGTAAKFRSYGHEIRGEVFKSAAKWNFEIFDFLVKNYIVKNDGLLQSETFHAKLINSFRNCKEYPEHLIRSLHLLTNEKNIYLNINKRISIANEGTLLHCLVEDPCFILRTLKDQNFDLIKYACYLGSQVDVPDKFGETPSTLVSKLNLSTLIKSCSTKRLMELFKLNDLKMNKEELNYNLKLWATNVVEYFVIHGASLTHQNHKKLNTLQIAERAENNLLCSYLYKQFGIDSDKSRRRTTLYSGVKN